MKKSMSKKHVSQVEAARLCGVSKMAVSRWCRAGEIKGVIKTPGKRGMYRIPLASIKHLIATPAATP